MYFFLSFPVQAQAVTLTVAQAFKVALDLWEVAQEGQCVFLHYVIFHEKKKSVHDLHARDIVFPCVCR